MTNNDNYAEYIDIYTKLLNSCKNQANRNNNIGNACYAACLACIMVAILCATKDNYEWATINALISGFNATVGKLNKNNAKKINIHAMKIQKIISDLKLQNTK